MLSISIHGLYASKYNETEMNRFLQVKNSVVAQAKIKCLLTIFQSNLIDRANITLPS